MKKAWIENNRIRDIAPGDPNELYHPEIAVFYDTDVPDDAQQGAELVNGVWVLPTPPELPVQPEIPQTPKVTEVSPVQFKLLFTSAERVKIKATRATDPVVDDFFEIIEDPRLTKVDLTLKSTADALAYLESLEILTKTRVEEILQGNVQ